MPGLYAAGQPIPATPAPHGLVSVSSEQKTPDRWELGYTICPENCVEASTWDPDCEAWPDGEKPIKSDAETHLDCYDVDPFVIETAFTCDAQGFTVVDFAGRARRQLEAGTPKALEFELWTGTLKPNNPNLQTGATVIGSGPYPPMLAMTLLGQALSNCAHGGIGTLHAPTWIVELWVNSFCLKEVGSRLTTMVRGDLIAAGTGYPGTGPNGIEPGNLQSWVYATGPVQHRLGDPQVFPETLMEALQKGSNDIEYRAERYAAVNFDPCCHFAILIEAPDAGSVGDVSL